MGLGDETGRIKIGQAFGRDGLLEDGMLHSFSLSTVPGLPQQEDSQPGLKSETLEVGFMGLGKAAGMFRVPPALHKNPSSESSRPSLRILWRS